MLPVRVLPLTVLGFIYALIFSFKVFMPELTNSYSLTIMRQYVNNGFIFLEPTWARFSNWISSATGLTRQWHSLFEKYELNVALTAFKLCSFGVWLRESVKYSLETNVTISNQNAFTVEIFHLNWEKNLWGPRGSRARKMKILQSQAYPHLLYSNIRKKFAGKKKTWYQCISLNP